MIFKSLNKVPIRFHAHQVLRKRFQSTDLMEKYGDYNEFARKAALPSLYAFLHRVGLSSENPSDFIEYIYVTPKIVPKKFLESEELGKTQLTSVVINTLSHKFPNVDRATLKRAVKTLTGDLARERVLASIGIHQIQYDILTHDRGKPVNHHGRNLFSLLGFLHAKKGLPTLTAFVNRYFLSAPILWKDYIDKDKAFTLLDAQLKNFNMPKVEMRLLNESGRTSPLPIYVVGSFSGLEKLAEGFGQSIEVARERAAMEALITRFYATNTLPK